MSNGPRLLRSASGSRISTSLRREADFRFFAGRDFFARRAIDYQCSLREFPQASPTPLTPLSPVCGMIPAMEKRCR
jgi:hypothetical protein